MLGTRRSILGAGEYRSSDVPQSEADALIAFYNATGGPAWSHKQGWLTDPVVNNWYGVLVSGGGSVSQIDLATNNLIGAAGSTLDPLASSLTKINISGNTGVTSLDVSSLTALKWLYTYQCAITTLDVSALTALEILYCYGSTVTTLDVTACNSMTDLRCWNCGVTTLDVNGMSDLAILRCNLNTIAVLDIANLTKLGYLDCTDNAMTEAEVDQIVQDIYDNWAAYTHASPLLYIAGTNAAPSGTYQDGDPPTTGKEYIYEIVVDPETTGNEKWAVTYTA